MVKACAEIPTPTKWPWSLSAGRDACIESFSPMTDSG